MRIISERAKLLYLMELLQLGAKDRFVKTPTTFLSRVFGISQQTASRVVNRLSREGLVDKRLIDGVTYVKLTESGLKKLKELKRSMEEAFSSPGVFFFEGRVFTGLGEGSYYMKKRGYRKQFYKTLGFEPYPGTLNVKLEREDLIEKNKRLRAMGGVKILGFEDTYRTYGDVYVYRAVVEESLDAAVIYAERTHYSEDVVELISPYYLRGKLGLKDGDTIRFKVLLASSL